MSSVVASRGNRHIRLLRAALGSKKSRKREGLFAVEGVRCLTEAIAAGWAPTCILVRHPSADPRVPEQLGSLIDPSTTRTVAVAADVLDSAVDVSASVDAVGLFELPAPRGERPELTGPAALLVLEEIRDPGNVGTILRTAHAAAISAVVLVGSCADAYSPKVVRSASGALFRVPLMAAADPVSAREAWPDVAHIAAVACEGQPWSAVDVRGPVALWLGNEARGLSEEALAACNARVHVPIVDGAESLNVASTAAVLAFEVVRQRRSLP